MTDPATWFQNSDGTTPATTLGDPVGFVMDKSGQGYNAIQATSAARPTHGRMPYGGVRNRMSRTEEFTHSAWGKSNCTAFDNQIAAPDGTLTGGLIVESATTTNHGLEYLQITLNSTITYTISAYAKLKERSLVRLGLRGATSNYAFSEFNLGDGTIGSQGALGTGWSVSSAEIQNVGDGWYRCSVSVVAGNSTTANSQTYLQLSAAGATTDTQGRAVYAGDGTSGAYLWGGSFEGGALSAYQKVVQRYNVTEAGKASVPSLWFDGTDDALDLVATAAALTKQASRVTMLAGASIAKAGVNILVASGGTSATQARCALSFNSVRQQACSGRRQDADTLELLEGDPVNVFLTTVQGAIFNYADAQATLRVDSETIRYDASFQSPGLTSNTNSLAFWVGRLSATTFLEGFASSAFCLRDTTLTESQLASLENYLMNQIGVAA